MLQIIAAITHSTKVKDADLLSLLRVAYLATKTSTPLSAEELGYPNTHNQCELTERTAYINRVPVSSIIVPNAKIDSPVQVAGASVLGPTALLRLLIVFAERGVLDKIPSWTALPAGTVPGTRISQVQQISSAAVLKILISVVCKRVVERREWCRMHVSHGNLYPSRAAYRQVAELGAAMASFERATNGLWRYALCGMRKELVLALGNASEMSNRLEDYQVALGFATLARDVARDAPANEGIGYDTIAKNERRIETARKNIKV